MRDTCPSLSTEEYTCMQVFVDCLISQTGAKLASLKEQAANNQQVEECTICYKPRVETYALYTCGHATFCARCALQLYENGDKCPNCRKEIKNPLLLYK